METHECDGCLKMIRGRRCWTYDYDLCTSCFACLPRKEMRRFMETLVLVGKQQQSYSVPGCWTLCAGHCRALLFTSAMEGSSPCTCMHAGILQILLMPPLISCTQWCTSRVLEWCDMQLHTERCFTPVV